MGNKAVRAELYTLPANQHAPMLHQEYKKERRVFDYQQSFASINHYTFNEPVQPCTIAEAENLSLFNSIKFYLFIAKTIELSQGAVYHVYAPDP